MVDRPSPPRPARPRTTGLWLLSTAFLVGLAVMVVEMTAVRAVAPYFGQSSHVWTNVIGVILAALAAGYFLGGRLADRFPRASVLYGVLLVGGALCLLVPLLVRPVSRALLPAELSAHGATGLHELASLGTTLILFAPPVLVLGAVAPLIIKLLARGGEVGNAAGRVFASSTVGSILGTFATTFVLVPHLGTRMTLALAGAVLVGTAAVGLVLVARGRATAGVATLGLLAAVLVPVGAAHTGPIKTARGPAQVEEFESAYQYVRVLRERQADGRSLRLLQFDEAESQAQSVAIEGTVLTDGRYYDYFTALAALRARSAKRFDVLVIGLAAGTIPKQLHRFYPRDLHVVGVEIDPMVVDVACRRFGLDPDADWLDVVTQDGRVYLNALAAEPRFDLIVIDAFARQDAVPFHLATREAFARARGALRDGGILALNVAARRPDALVLSAIETTVGSVFGPTWRVWVDGYANYMVYALKNAEPDFDRLRSVTVGGDAESTALRELAREIAARSVAGAGHTRPVPALTDDLAPVEAYMNEDATAAQRAQLGD